MYIYIYVVLKHALKLSIECSLLLVMYAHAWGFRKHHTTACALVTIGFRITLVVSLLGWKPKIAG